MSVVPQTVPEELKLLTTYAKFTEEGLSFASSFSFS